MNRLLSFAFGLLVALSGLCGCTDRGPAPEITEPDVTAQTDTPILADEEAADMTASEDRTLVRLEYETRSGSVYGGDFAVSITPEAVETALYFDEALGDYAAAEHQAITENQWADILRAMEALDGFLAVRLDRIPSGLNEWNDGMVLDGGDSQSLFLTWQDAAGETERLEYVIPDDRRFLTLTDLLQETAHPTGREIVWYDAPELQGIYFRKGDAMASGYSYQCTYLPDEDGTYGGDWYFIAYDGEVSGSTHVAKEVWEELSAACQDLGLLDLAHGSSSESSYVTLYLTDGTQYSVNPDRKTMTALRDLFSRKAEALLG